MVLVELNRANGVLLVDGKVVESEFLDVTIP